MFFPDVAIAIGAALAHLIGPKDENILYVVAETDDNF